MLVDGGACLWWHVQLRDQDMPPRSLLHAISPSCWASEALALRALHLIVETSYRVFSLLRPSRVWAFILLRATGWWRSLFRHPFWFIGGKLYISRVCGLFVFLEFVRCLLGYWLRGGHDEDTRIRNMSFSSLSLLISWSRACTCLSFLHWRLSILSRQSK